MRDVLEEVCVAVVHDDCVKSRRFVWNDSLVGRDRGHFRVCLLLSNCINEFLPGGCAYCAWVIVEALLRVGRIRRSMPVRLRFA